MGNLKSKGGAIDCVSPGGAVVIYKGELYRYNKWNVIAMSTVLPTDPELGFAGEVSESIWWVQAPSGLVANQGDTLWWSATEGFKQGPSQLVVSGTSGAIGPACKVETAIDSNYIVGVRVLNVS
jgi:hypothetical protein